MVRNYKQEYKDYHGKPAQIAARASRNAARASKGLSKGDGKEVDHKVPLSKGGSSANSNLRVTTRHTNRVKANK